MNPKHLDTLVKSILGLTSKAMRLEARCDALEIACEVLSRKAGLPPDKLLHSIDQMTAAAFQKRLERIEGVDPATAAELDTRPSLPDLPDELL